MSKRLKKQTIIGFVYLFLIGMVVGVPYFLLKADPSCYDKIQNQKEEGVDCGGPCPSCQSETLKKIEVVWAKLIPATKDYYDLIIKLNNPNQNHGTGKAPYSVKIYDSSRQPVEDYQATTYILPKQTKFIVKHRIRRPYSYSSLNAEVSFGEIEWRQLDFSVSASLLPIQEKEFELSGPEAPGYAFAKGVVANETNFDFQEIEIDVLLYNANHNLISARSNKINTFLSGEKRGFTVDWYQEIEEEVAYAEMEAETNFFDTENYISGMPEGLEKFQQYK